MELRTITKEELATILEKHKMWLNDKEGGERANLENANLENANLRNANLVNANLENANLWKAYLRNACLVNANLGENHVRVYNFTEYSCYRANDYFRAGCQIHTIEEWKNFTEEQIRSMDGYKAWKFYTEVLLKIIDL